MGGAVVYVELKSRTWPLRRGWRVSSVCIYGGVGIGLTRYRS